MRWFQKRIFMIKRSLSDALVKAEKTHGLAASPRTGERRTRSVNVKSMEGYHG